MNNYQEIVIQNGGHLLKVVSETLSSYLAFQKVQNNIHEYWRAEKDIMQNQITLQKRIFTCVNCAKDFQLEFCDNNKDDENGVDDSSDFMNWAIQLAIPGLEPDNQPFIFQPAINYNEEIICSHCGFSANIIKNPQTFFIQKEKQLTTITYQIDYADFIEFKPTDIPYNQIYFPLTAKLLFDHATHKTIFIITNNKGMEIKHEDITAQIAPLKNYSITKQINSSLKFKEALLDIFMQFYNRKFPYNPVEITLELLVLLNRFQGFDRNFYNSVPFNCENKKLSSKFQKVVNYLSDYNQVEALLNITKLSKTKAIKKIIYQNPCLLFYKYEIEMLPFQNNDVVQQILSSPEAYNLLAVISECPDIILFLSKMIEKKGETATWRAIKKKINHLADAATMYLILPEHKKEEALKEKINVLGDKLYNRGLYSFNIPIKNRFVFDISPNFIDDYEFIPLCNTLEQHIAASTLNNCLSTCIWDNVITIKLYGTYVAAIELENKNVVQAKIKNNLPIENDDNIYKAFNKWLEQNELEYISN